MAGEISAEYITEKYYHDVYRFCCSRCKDADIAQDITHDTFLLFIEKKNELTDNNIRSWLLSVANNKVHEYFREKNARNNVACIDDVKLPYFDNYETDDIDIDEIFDDVQQKILEILNENERELFIRLYMERKSVSLIVKELDITEENFRTRKSRLKKKIKGSIGHMYFFMVVLSFKFLH